MTPEFSVVLPTRGDSAHLRAALASALASSGPELEVLLIHDRREGEPSLVASAHADPRVRLESLTDAGPSGARNAGIEQARGRYLAFLDDDDLWLPHHLARARDALAVAPGTTLYACDAYLFDDRTPDGSAEPPADLARLDRFSPRRAGGRLTLRDLLLANPILTPTVVLARDRLESGDRFRDELEVMEDYDLWLRLARHHRLVFDSRPGAIVRRRSASASRDRRGMAERSIHVLERHLGHGPAPGPLSQKERRHRLGRLWHDLAYACLAEGDLPAARSAARRSAGYLPLLGKNYMYLLASLLPGRLRGGLLATGGRLRGTREGGGAPAP